MLTHTLTDKIDGNGRPIVEYSFDGSDGMEGVIITGPAKGEIVLSDGTRYDLTPEVIEHLPGHAGPITHHIERQHELSGKLAELRPADPTHTCTEACGDERE
jgi:hypothetical protein